MDKKSKERKRIKYLCLLHREVDEFAETIAPIYALLQWKWIPEGVPSKEQIVEALHGLIFRLECERNRRAETGGLFVDATWDSVTESWDVGMGFSKERKIYEET